MPLIDASYFEEPILLDVAGNETAIDQSIETHEPDYLIAALGPSLYDAFITGLATPSGVYFSNQFSDQFFKGTIEDRWKWIRDGHTFTYGGRKYIWPGLQNARKRSPLANYVYCASKKGSNSITTATGEEAPKGANRVRVKMDMKYVRAWNEMVEWNKVLIVMIRGVYDGPSLLYPEFVRCELSDKRSVDIYNPLNTVF